MRAVLARMGSREESPSCLHCFRWGTLWPRLGRWQRLRERSGRPDTLLPAPDTAPARPLGSVLAGALTRHVEDRVRLFELLSQDLDSFDCRKNDQFDLVALRLAFHFFHHRQSAECTGTDDELAAFPGYVLFDGQWRVPKVIAEFLGRLFLAVADLPAVDDHVVHESAVVDAEGAK